MKLRHAIPLFVLLVTMIAAAEAPPAPAPAAPDPNKAEGRFKNIQVMNGYWADDVFPAMQFISASLGVGCDYCHVEHAPEKDDKKEKQIARKMIAMTVAINHDHFDGHREVTCVSCHRGAPRPLTVPAITSGESEQAALEGKAAALPAAASILDKYVRAVGGAEAIAKVATRVQKGKLSGMGPEPVPVDVSTKSPEKRITTVHSQRGDTITAVNGQAGWLGNTGRPPRDMSPAESGAARVDAAFLYGSDPKPLFKSFKVAPTEKIDGKDAVHVIGMNDGQLPVDLWFDPQSGLLVRLERYAETPLGRNPTQIDYADYRDADGVKIPFRWTVARPSGRFTIQLDESRQNVPVDDKVFQKASQPPPS